MNSPALLFKQAVRSAHRAVVVIKVHFESLQEGTGALKALEIGVSGRKSGPAGAF
jgi:hypothetical protein